MAIIGSMSDRYRRFIPFFLAVLALATVFPGLFLSFEDSEIWGITSSRRIIENPFAITSAHFKPLFSLIYGGVVSLASNDWTALMASRWLTMAFAAAGLYSLYSLGLMLSQDSKNVNERSTAFFTVLYFAVVGTLPLMVVHFPKSRSDSVAAGLTLVASLLILAAKNQTNLRRGLYLTSAISALLITPKSIDFVVVLALMFNLSEVESLTPKHRMVKWAWLLSPLILVSAVAILTSREILLRTLIYWVGSYSDIDLTTLAPWLSALRAIATGPIVALLIGVGLLIGLTRFSKFDLRERTFFLAGTVCLAFIIVHSQKYFFFLASRVPFLALGALPGVLCMEAWARSRLTSDRLMPSKILGLVFFVSLAVTAMTLQNYSGFYLRFQKAVYVSLASYMQKAEITHYWDAIGLFPKRNSIFHYPSPGDETNKRIVEYVEFSRPNVVLRSSKMELLEPDVIAWLASKYIALGDQIFIRYFVLKTGPTCRLDEADFKNQLTGQKFSFPLAMFTRIKYGNRWVRIPIRWSGGNDRDNLQSSEFNGAFIELNNCDQPETQYAITESKPWDALPAPIFSQFFGYDGTL